MSETADHRTQTCQIRLRDGKLPNLRKLEQHIVDMRVGASLRGVEAVIAGSLQEADAAISLRVSESEDRVRLSPLRRVVQWSLEKKREHSITRAERAAYSRLTREKRDPAALVMVCGPLAQNPETGEFSLEVRSFKFLAQKAR